MAKSNIKDKHFKEAVKEASCMRDVCLLLDVRVSGRVYKSFKERIARLGLDTSHWNNRKKHVKAERLKLEDILVKDSDYQHGTTLKKMLLRHGMLEYRCYTCGIRDWQDKHINLHLDHINGDRQDHRLQNLRLLCPNCHTQTHTYGNKNNKSSRSSAEVKRAIEKGKKKLKNKYNFCKECNKGIVRRATYCKSCYGRKKKGFQIEWPDIDTLAKMVKEKGYTAVGKELGVSDNAVRKHLLNYS